ncbi:MAG: hypothetical protein ACRDSN_17010 [Pseudonocardiaceae bacterium]
MRGLVVNAARRAGSGEADPGWARWSHELFADAFAIASVGPAHLWLLEELELASEARMLTDAGAYPPSVARRFFGEHILAALAGLDGTTVRAPTIQGDGPDAPRARGLVPAVPEVARELVDQPLDGLGTLRDLADWRPGWFDHEGEVERWKARLVSNAALIADRKLETARAVAAAAVAIGREIAAEPNAEKRDASRKHVAPRILELMAESREPGDRAPAETAPTGVDELANRVARALRQVAVETA